MHKETKKISPLPVGWQVFVIDFFMSLNSIKFDTTDIALLFKSSLVEVNTEQSAATKSRNDAKQTISKPDPIGSDSSREVSKYLGENKQKILVLVRYADIAYLPDRQLSFLTKLLAACSLTIADVAILNFQNYDPTSFDEIINFFKPKVILLFDIAPDEFGMPMIFPHFQVQGYKDAVFVSSPSLESIEPDKTLKGKLWTSLKKIFNL